MPEPLRSPKQSRVTAKSRSHPYARPSNNHRNRDGGVERPNSLFGTLKSIVTAPLSWLSSGDSQQPFDTSPQKRRVSGAERGGTPPSSKRVRRESPEEVGYPDPPSSVFAPKRPPIPLWNVANGVPPARTMSIDPPPSSLEPTDVPLPDSRGPSILSHTSMSVEPQQEVRLFRRCSTRDLSMPPLSPFARTFSRSSLTPQPAGATFGPSPKRRTRELTAPPLLGSSTSMPAFTRPPPPNAGPHQNLFQKTQSRERSEGPISTLLGLSSGSMSPVRDNLTQKMLTSHEGTVSRSPSKLSAERTLSTLESFRTPLHTARFASSSFPEERRPRKVHVPIPSKLRFDHAPEGKKDKPKRGPTVIGPYSSGMSGMRKLLARRRDELEKEAEDTVTDSEPERTQGAHLETSAETDALKSAKKDGKGIETEKQDGVDSQRSRVEGNGVAPKNDTVLRSRSPTRSKADSYSSLRAPVSRVSRTHAPAPKLKKPRNKFSLNDDEEQQQQEWSMSIEELKGYQARARSSISFSNTRRMSETGMQTETSSSDASHIRAASPPLPAQPQTFDSLLSRIGLTIPVTSKSSTEFPAEPLKTESDAKLPASGESTAPATLPFSFGVSSVPPAPSKAADSTPTPFASIPEEAPTPASSATVAPPDGVPAFFANTKVHFTPPTVPTGSLFGGSPAGDGNGKAGEQPAGSLEATPAQTNGGKKESEIRIESKPTTFSSVNKLSLFGGASTSPSGSTPLGTNAAPTTALNTTTPFGGLTDGSGSADAPKSTFSFGTPASSGSDVSKPGLSFFGTANKAAPPATASEVQAKPAFSFGAPLSASPLPAGKPEVAATTSTTDASTEPAFSFGTPAASTSSEAPKNFFAFGSSIQPKVTDAKNPESPFSFGAAPSTPPPVEKKPAFTFGVTSGTNMFSSGTGNGMSSPAPDVPKPLFSGFGQNSTAPPTTPKPTETMVDSSDRMETTGDRMEESPTRSVEKKVTHPPLQLPQTPFQGFGGGGGGGTSFSFGQDKGTPTTGGFSFEPPKPTPATGFSFGQTANASTSAVPGTNTGFSFGQGAAKPTGQSTSLFGASSAFGAGATNPTGSSPFPFSQPSTGTSSNPFGQPKQTQENGSSSAPSSPLPFSQSASLPQSPSFSFSVPSATGPFGAPKLEATSSTSSTQPFQFGAPSSSQQPQGQQGGTAATPNMFTLGGAATPTRKVKGLPTRRAKRP